VTILIPVLGDQLSSHLSSLGGADRANSVVLMMEVADETTYVRHHKIKLAYILSAMRHHAEALRADGWRVEYVRLDDPETEGVTIGARQARTSTPILVVWEPVRRSLRDGSPCRVVGVRRTAPL
jgi:deoxyribodipyrimidine photolyase-like uncharacterized protein